jgi:hypothetical protein
MSRQPVKKSPSIEARTQELREAIARMDFVVSGMVSKRTKPCGKPNCRCAKGPETYHGPYYEWHHYQDGHLVHKTITPEQFEVMERAVANHREILRLLSIWEQETIEVIMEKPENT